MNDLAEIIYTPDFDLNGTHLVAASAGTGKTYNIETLYLRLLLEQELTVKQILVVTFTVAATYELRDRLRKALDIALKNVTQQGASPDERVSKILDLLSPERKSNIRATLLQALADFDVAPIYTIHSFCQRVLTRFAFETEQMFETKLATGNSNEINRLCANWWRQNISASSSFARLLWDDVDKKTFSLANLSNAVKKVVAKPDALLLPEPLTVAELTKNAAALMLQAKNLTVPSFGSQDSSCPQTVLSTLRHIEEQLTIAHGAALKNNALKFAYALNMAEQQQISGDTLQFDDSILEVIHACQKLATLVGRKKASSFVLEEGYLKYTKGKLDGFCEADEHLRQVAQNNIPGYFAKFAGDPLSKNIMRHNITVVGLLQFVLDYAQNVAGISAEAILNAVKDLASRSEYIPQTFKVSLIGLAPEWAELASELRKEYRRLYAGVVIDIANRYRYERALRATMTYDDMLLNLREALKGPQAAVLKNNLRTTFRAALIDEFQDTDPVQYDIFAKIFRENGDDSSIPCFFVGDPKQAIYRFRNGDIETYRLAVDSIKADRKHLLNCNYRSEARLITAVNQIFGDRDREDTKYTFMRPEMVYDGTLKAAGKSVDNSLTINGKVDSMPFKIKFYHIEQQRAIIPGQSSPTAFMTYGQVAAQIVELLNDETISICGRRVRPGDIAVLIVRNAEGIAIERELHERGVPSVVLLKDTSVYDSPEVQEFKTLVEAMANPRDVRAVRTALLTDIVGLTPENLEIMNEGGSGAVPLFDTNNGSDDNRWSLEDFIIFFEQLKLRWQRAGFASAFQDLMRKFGTRGRLASMPRGERVLTNVLHLSELLHGSAVTRRLTIDGTLELLRRQIDPDNREYDESQELRLESDCDAVRILTIHKSKGLEFPIVFVPTLWMLEAKAGHATSIMWESHGTDGKLAITLKNGGTSKEEQDNAKNTAQQEDFEENLRLAYVALTRAKHRTVLFAAKVKLSKNSKHALTRLFDPDDPQQFLKKRFGNDLAIEIETEDLEQAPVIRYTPSTAKVNELEPLLEMPSVEKRFGHASFSGLAPHAGKIAPEITDMPVADLDQHTDADSADHPEIEKMAEPLFEFPGGVSTGTCWHAIFEAVNFQANDEEIRTVCGEKLQQFGFFKDTASAEHEQRLNSVSRMVKRTLSTTLPKLGLLSEPFKLQEITTKDKICEWGFSFPASTWHNGEPWRTTAITEILRFEWSGDPEKRLFVEDLEKWDKAIPGGFLTGFIDLLFRHDERYYIIDWKSNRIGYAYGDYEHFGIAKEMNKHAYYLQYLFYAVAVHQYLKHALFNYSYDRNFGGVYYLFLRGIDGVSNRGIFADRPSEKLLEELSMVLGRFT